MDYANALTTGIDGSIYIAGFISGFDLDKQANNDEGSNAFIAKYNPDGTKEWIKF